MIQQRRSMPFGMQMGARFGMPMGMPMGMAGGGGGGGGVGMDLVQQAAIACLPQGGGGVGGYGQQMQMSPQQQMAMAGAYGQMQPQQQQGAGVGGCGYSPSNWLPYDNGCPLPGPNDVAAQSAYGQAFQGGAAGQYGYGGMYPTQAAAAAAMSMPNWTANPCFLYPRLRGPRCIPLVLENAIIPAAAPGPVGTFGAPVTITIKPTVPFQADTLVISSDVAGALSFVEISSNSDQFLIHSGGGNGGYLPARVASEANGGCCCISLGGVIISELSPLKIIVVNKQTAPVMLEGAICGVGFFC